MAMRLALQMSRPDVDCLLEELTPEQFDEWQAYYAIEPWGDPWAHTAQLSWIAWTGLINDKRSEEEFRPSFSRAPKVAVELTDEQVEAQKQAMQAMYG